MQMSMNQPGLCRARGRSDFRNLSRHSNSKRSSFAFSSPDGTPVKNGIYGTDAPSHGGRDRTRTCDPALIKRML